ncbi:MAG TPA: serine hydrolase domain-containing protein [Vitreimonas sp.]|nr:serine hydrolase domain-containing protein [Vitreimonas sp.]
MQINRRAFVGASVVAGAVAGSARAATESSRGSAAQRAALNTLSHYVEQHRADWGLPGMTVCVVDRDGYTGFIRSGFAHLEDRTPVGAAHLFQIGSISKMMCALVVWQLVQEGKLSLDAKLSALMPELRVDNGGDITLQHLLNHTAGLPDDAPMQDALWSAWTPGLKWSYSNTGYEICGEIVARTDGRSYPEALAARLLTPLGMRETKAGIRVGDRMAYAQGYEPPLNDRANLRPGPRTQTPWIDTDFAAGCVASTAHDMAIFARFLIDLAQGKGGAALRDDAAAQFIAVAAPAPGWAENAQYGNGIARIVDQDRHYWHHTGGMVSFSSSIHVDTEAGVACFASSNIGGLNYRPRDVTLYACQLLRAARDGGQAPAPKPTRAVVDHPEKYAGRYTAQNGESFELVAAGDQLKMRYQGRESAVQQMDAGFACAESRFAVPGLVIETETDHAVRAWADDVEFLRDPSIGYKPPASAELRALAGRYDNDDRWYGPTTFVARDGKLWAGNAAPMRKTAAGHWVIDGDDATAEHLNFDAVINGKATRFWYSGRPFVRRFS